MSNNVNPLLRDVNDIFTIIKKYDEIVMSKKLETAFDEVDELKGKMDFPFLIKEIIKLLEGIECFPSKLNQVIMNILTNSIQAIDGKGEIIIQTISSSIGIKIIIKDNGKGMTPEVKKHIFDPFYTTKDVGEGTGLGLSISYGIIEQHKGNIDVISEPGKGTEFIISLPRTLSN